MAFSALRLEDMAMRFPITRQARQTIFAHEQAPGRRYAVHAGLWVYPLCTPTRKQSGAVSRIESDPLRHLAPRGERLRGGMSQGHAYGARAARYRGGTRFAHSMYGVLTASDRSLEIAEGIPFQSFMRFSFARTMTILTRVSTIADGSFEDCNGVESQRDVPRGSPGIRGWTVT